MLINIKQNLDNFNNLENKNRIIVFVLGVILIFVVFLFMVFSVLKGNILNQGVEELHDGPTDKYDQSAKQKAKESEDENDASYRVTGLISKLPYSGNNFTLEYNYNSFMFTLTLNQSNTGQALEEYGLFLQQNNVRRDLVERNLIQLQSGGF